MKLLFREVIKGMLQYIVLPIIYYLFSYQKIDNDLVVFADSKNNKLPYSMKSMFNEVKSRNYKIHIHIKKYKELSMFFEILSMISFVKDFAKAKYVFISDYFIPVALYNKKKNTKVIQLWHSSGLQKKFGWDAKDDLGKNIFSNPVKYYDLVCVSNDNVRKVFERAWNLTDDIVQSLGSSRTDILFNEEYKKKCKKFFFEKYPEAFGKKIILWAPSFRSNAIDAKVEGVEDILKLRQYLNKNYYLIIKLHPHIEDKYKINNCIFSTDEIYPVVDVLITDYSSIFYDFLLLKKQVIFFLPDYNEYIEKRGMYIKYEDEFNFPVIKDVSKLEKAIYDLENNNINSIDFDRYIHKFIKMNDGNVSKRIMDYLEYRNG